MPNFQVNVFFGLPQGLDRILEGEVYGVAKVTRNDTERRFFIYRTATENVWVWARRELKPEVVTALSLGPFYSRRIKRMAPRERSKPIPY